jgi:hypothetical protein
LNNLAGSDFFDYFCILSKRYDYEDAGNINDHDTGPEFFSFHPGPMFHLYKNSAAIGRKTSQSIKWGYYLPGGSAPADDWNHWIQMVQKQSRLIGIENKFLPTKQSSS